MPHFYSIHPQFNLVWATRYGTITVQELTALNLELRADPAFTTDMVILNDFRLTDDIDFGYSQLAPFAEASKKPDWAETAPTKIACVTPAPLAFGMARMFQSLMAGQNRVAIEVYQTIDAAVDALNLPAEARALVANPREP